MLPGISCGLTCFSFGLCVPEADSISPPISPWYSAELEQMADELVRPLSWVACAYAAVTAVLD